MRKCHRSAALRGGGSNPPTLEAAIDEMLGPLHLLCSHLLNHVQILKCGGGATLTVVIQTGRPFGMRGAHLQRLNSGGNEITYHANLSAFLWVCWEKTRPRTRLVDVLDHCQLCRDETF